MKKTIISVLLIALTSCAGTGGGTGGLTPAQILSAAHEVFGLAQMGEMVYASFPACGTPAKQPCSNPAVVAQLSAAAASAQTALAAADAQQTAGTLTSGSAALLLVQTAVSSYFASTQQPGVPVPPSPAPAKLKLPAAA